MKTLQECKSEVAKKNGFKDWDDLLKVWQERVGQTPVVHENYIDQVAELYARQFKDLVSEMFDLTKCGYAHNYGSPSPDKLEMLAKAKSILDGEEVTAKDIQDWLH